jgi:hypothetical protein
MVDVKDTIPASVAIELRVVPVREIGSTLVLATDCNTETETKSRLVFILNRDVRFVVRSTDWIDAELDAHYRSSGELLGNTSDDNGISWYWPSWHYLDGDKLVVKASGWEGMMHWTGAREFPVNHPDREFWNWLITVDYYSNGLLDDREIPRIKRIWNRYRRRSTAATNKAIHRSRGSAAS